MKIDEAPDFSKRVGFPGRLLYRYLDSEEELEGRVLKALDEDGYRLVESTEKTIEGDQYWDGRKWTDEVGTLLSPTHCIFRRKKL